jgi:hypothetical protein
MMRRIDSFQLWWCAVAFLVAVAAPALAIEPQGFDSRGATHNNMTTQSKIVSDALASAEWISRALSQSGYKADFTLESLKQVDRFFEEQAENGQPKAGGLLSQQLVHVCLQSVPMLARSSVVRIVASGRVTTMTLTQRSMLSFA